MQWDPETANKGGRVSEMLSEHTLQGFLQGYTLTGRTGLFPSYEAFLGKWQTKVVHHVQSFFSANLLSLVGIVTTMIEQYAKCKRKIL